jgi:tight adherence protein C
MSVPQIAFLLATFGFVSTLSWIAFSIVSQTQNKRRLNKIARPESRKARTIDWRQRILTMVRPLAKLASPKEQWENSPLRQRFLHAGYRNQSAATAFLAIKTATVITFPALFLVFGPASQRLIATALWAIVLAAVGYYLPDVMLRQKIAKRQREILDDFPDAVDLLTVCVEAGLGLDAALSRVTEELRVKCPVLAEELHLVNLELRAGGTRQQALRNFALRTGLDELNTFVAMLVQAERFGTSIADSLRVYSAELRGKRRVRAEEAAAKVAVKLLFPLMFCLFPALMLVIMGPGIINIYRHLVPSLGH